MHQGDAGTCAYIIKQGHVEILIETQQGQIHYVGKRGPGAMIGEMAIIDEAPRTATVRALDNCELLEITQEDFKLRMDEADPVLKMAVQIILTRYRDMLKRAEIIGDPPRAAHDVETLELRYTEGSDALETVRITNEFESALENDEIVLFYQPVMNFKTGGIAGFEALMRWEHPERGLISPAVFIPVIEDTSLIVKASQWALRKSLRALKRLESRAGFEDELFMSVNFSSRDFSSEDFIGSVYDTISASDVRPEQLHIEITERLLMGQPQRAQETLSMCRKAGIGISIDDFGTGYSSLSYLHSFPIDTLKIDRSFVKDMTDNTNSFELVKSVIGLGKNLNMKTVAEGVETAEQAEALKDLGCDLAQGYYYCKPLPEGEVSEFAREHHKA